MPATDEPTDELSSAQQAVGLDTKAPNDTFNENLEKSDTGETVWRRSGRLKGTAIYIYTSKPF